MAAQLKDEAERLGRKISEAEARLSALRQESAGTKAAIAEVQRQCLARIETVGDKAGGAIDVLLEAINHHTGLQEEAARLEMELKVARAISRDDQEQWEALPREGIQRLCLGIVRWAKAQGRNRMVRAPEVIRQRARHLLAFTEVQLADIFSWGLLGTISEEEVRQVQMTAQAQLR